jgi:hypothetical protein
MGILPTGSADWLQFETREEVRWLWFGYGCGHDEGADGHLQAPEWSAVRLNALG